MNFSEKAITLICGHYGVGKTNVSVQYARSLKAAGHNHVMLLDFDIVNPYFRSADNRGELEQEGIEVIVPDYANTNVDLPTLPPQVLRVFETDCRSVFDVGGDDSGATALGTYSRRIEEKGYELYVVVNACRPYVRDPRDALAMIRAIEVSARLGATGIVNNTNLGRETTPEIVREGFAYAAEICRLAGLPLIATTCFAGTADALTAEEREIYRVLPIGDVSRRIF